MLLGLWMPLHAFLTFKTEYRVSYFVGVKLKGTLSKGQEDRLSRIGLVFVGVSRLWTTYLSIMPMRIGYRTPPLTSRILQARVPLSQMYGTLTQILGRFCVSLL